MFEGENFSLVQKMAIILIIGGVGATFAGTFYLFFVLSLAL